VAKAGPGDSALAQRLATISLYQDHVSAGCLMNYGQNVADFHQRAARYVDKILGLRGIEWAILEVENARKLGIARRFCILAELRIRHE